MPKQTRLSALSVNVEADAFASTMDGGFIDIYDGEQPDNGDLPLNGQRRGVTLSLGTPAFGPAVDGVITANPIAVGIIVTDIKATWGRVYRADHATKVMDCSVGVANANVVLRTTNFVAGVSVSCSLFQHTVAKATPGT